MNWQSLTISGGILGLLVMSWLFAGASPESNIKWQHRQEVVFWHFWGGRDRQVVESVVRKFNESQSQYRVRAVAMPGNNLQAKLFLSVTGGDPPDLVNQDDPVLADWAARGIVQPIRSCATDEEIQELDAWLFSAARRLSQFQGQYYAVCNGLDIRALFYNRWLLQQHGLSPPDTIHQLDHIAQVITPPNSERKFYGYLPDSRRLWAWGYVFGGQFFDESTRQVTLDSDPIVRAAEWMSSYSRRYGADNLAAFRQADQSLPGKPFPLLPLDEDSMVGRYGMIMDGQWRTRDIRAFTENRQRLGLAAPEFGVCPLPRPSGGRADSGWVNGNFFIIPTGAKCPAGAWAFIRFWIGLADPAIAAETSAEGGWIPVSQNVVRHPRFQEFLSTDPLFAEFVRLAASPNQFPTPGLPGAAMFKRTVEAAAFQAMTYPERPVRPLLEEANRQIQAGLDRRHDE